MKKYILLLILTISTSIIFSQGNTEIGILFGTSYYHGDINKSKLFYSPSLAGGLIAKYNLSNHLSTTITGFYGKLKGADSDFDFRENQLRGESFAVTVIDVSVLVEFNFMPYTSSGYIKKNENRFSPFIFLGIGGNYLMGSEGFKNPITIPFGLGIKYNIFERLTLGLEWGYHKTFNDLIDGITNKQDAENTPVIHNDDWYSSCGVFLTYKLSKNKINCPTYE